MKTNSVDYKMYQDIGNVAILQNKIAEIDRYTCILPLEPTLGNICCSVSKKSPYFVTSQLLYIVSLEEELDIELSNLSDKSSSTKEILGGKNAFRDHEMIADLQSRIRAWESKTEENWADHCFSSFLQTDATNAILTRQILCMRLDREMKKKGHAYNYGAIEGPSMTAPPDYQEGFQNRALIDTMRRDIARLEYDPNVETNFKRLGTGGFVYSIYVYTKAHDLRKKLRRELEKPMPGGL